jgi:recombination protein RecT
MTSQEVETRGERTPAQILASRVRSDQFQQEVALALPENMPAHRFVRATVTALLQNPDLAKLDPDSIFQSLLRSAQDGLLPDGREAALVAFGDKAQYLPMIGGLRKIAAEHGWAIRTQAVYENDDFEYELGLETSLRHRQARTDRGPLVAAYAVATHRDGRKEFEVMLGDEIAKVRNVSRAKERGPWKDWPERMWEKTVGRRIFKKLPLDPNDADRVARVLDAASFDPAQAAALLYGPETPRQIAAAPDPSAAPPADAPAAPSSSTEHGTGDQQAGEQEQADAPDSPAPGPDQPEPTVGGGFKIPEAAIDEAGQTIITKATDASGVKGRTIADVCGSLEGEQWAGWAIRTAKGYYTETFRTQLELYVQHRLPHVWAAFMAEREEQASS